MKAEGLLWDLAVGTYDADTSSYVNVVADGLTHINRLSVRILALAVLLSVCVCVMVVRIYVCVVLVCICMCVCQESARRRSGPAAHLRGLDTTPELVDAYSCILINSTLPQVTLTEVRPSPSPSLHCVSLWCGPRRFPACYSGMRVRARVEVGAARQWQASLAPPQPYVVSHSSLPCILWALSCQARCPAPCALP